MNIRLIALSAALLLVAGGASAAEKQAHDNGWDVPGQHDSDTAETYAGPQQPATGAPRALQPHQVMISARDSTDGMPEVRHAGSLSDDPHSGTASGMSKNTANPATSPDRLTRADHR